MSKAHHWRKAAMPIDLSGRKPSQTQREEAEAVRYFSDVSLLNRSMRRFFRSKAKRKGKQL